VIFATVGTTDFDVLVQAIDELAPRQHEDVICQIGNGRYAPRNCEYFRFAPSLADYLERARVVVSHGGQGSIMDVVRLGKPLVGVSNPDRHDHHQDDILAKFAELKHLIWCRSLDELEGAIALATRAQFAPYVEPPCAIHVIIDGFLLERQRGDAGRRGVNGLRRWWRGGGAEHGATR
jgi:beta-1,4-N-acetylglucosaminyltransferase